MVFRINLIFLGLFFISGSIGPVMAMALPQKTKSCAIEVAGLPAEAAHILEVATNSTGLVPTELLSLYNLSLRTEFKRNSRNSVTWLIQPEASALLAYGAAKFKKTPEAMMKLFMESSGYTSAEGWHQLQDSTAAMIAVLSAMTNRSPADLHKIYSQNIRVKLPSGPRLISEKMSATFTAYQILFKKLDIEAQMEKFRLSSSSDMFSVEPFLELLKP